MTSIHPSQADAVSSEPQPGGPESFSQRIGRIAGSSATLDWSETTTDDILIVELAGQISINEAPILWKRVSQVLDGWPRPSTVRVRLSAVESIDGACLALLVHMQSELKRRGVKCDFAGTTPAVQKLLRLHRRKRRRARPDRRPRSTIGQIGEVTADAVASSRNALAFIGELVINVVGTIRRPSTLNLRDVTLTMERAGADAVPIVVLINFLIGFVMAFQSAPQLEQFGANILVADLVGLAVVRELGPLMTAIIVCGRSGAAFAAELGTMKVSEEVDALRTLGLTPLRYLVIPRIAGLVIVAPALTLIADVVGITGGLVVGWVRLDLTTTAFMTQLSQVVRIQDVVSGLVKSVAFSVAIGLIACERGLSAKGGAAEVGRRTTSAVVTILFSLIVLDAVFTVALGGFSL